LGVSLTKDQIAEELKRCERCGFPYARTVAGGCRPGNCSHRPVMPLRMGRDEKGGFDAEKYAADCRALADKREIEGRQLIEAAKRLRAEAVRTIANA
jgi:hypothetical protein